MNSVSLRIHELWSECYGIHIMVLRNTFRTKKLNPGDEYLK